MRTIILLTIFAVLPISCRFYLYRQLAGDDEAQQSAQKLVDTVILARKTHNRDLFLSCFDKSFTGEDCGHTQTYADLEKDAENFPSESGPEPSSSPAQKYQAINAVIEGEYLKFEVIEVAKNVASDKVTAVRSGAGFKMISVQTRNCHENVEGYSF